MIKDFSVIKKFIKQDKSTSDIHINYICSKNVKVHTFSGGPYYSGKNKRILRDYEKGGLPYSKSIKNYPEITTQLPEVNCVPENNKNVIALGNYLIKDASEMLQSEKKLH